MSAAQIKLESPNAEDIRKARALVGLTQAEAGAVLGHHRVSWSRYENGARPMCPVQWAFWKHIVGLTRLPFGKQDQ